MDRAIEIDLCPRNRSTEIDLYPRNRSTEIDLYPRNRSISWKQRRGGSKFGPKSLETTP